MKITIVNYHYVRPLPDKNFPNIKAFDLKRFEERLQYYRANFHFICPNQILEIVGKKSNFKDLIWLTFDDGISDHYEYVYPLLKKYEIPATFFPSAHPINYGTVLPVHKIQLILSTGEPIKNLITQLKRSCMTNGLSQNDFETLIKNSDFNSRFDDNETSIFKKTLQKYLPSNLRPIVLNEIFEQVVGKNEKLVSRQFYLQREQIGEMLDNNMTFGGHGDEHLWLGESKEDDSINEIRASAKLLSTFPKIKTRIFSYPYGSYTERTKEILKDHSFDIALTTKPEHAYLSQNSLLELGRFDANDKH